MAKREPLFLGLQTSPTGIVYAAGNQFQINPKRVQSRIE